MPFSRIDRFKAMDASLSSFWSWGLNPRSTRKRCSLLYAHKCLVSDWLCMAFVRIVVAPARGCWEASGEVSCDTFCCGCKGGGKDIMGSFVGLVRSWLVVTGSIGRKHLGLR
jgi:hypothetical protein